MLLKLEEHGGYFLQFQGKYDNKSIQNRQPVDQATQVSPEIITCCFGRGFTGAAAVCARRGVVGKEGMAASGTRMP